MTAASLRFKHHFDRFALDRLAGRLQAASKPILEINAQSELVQNIASVADHAFREDAVRLLLDEARILDGDKPGDPRAFAGRQARLFSRAIGQH